MTAVTTPSTDKGLRKPLALVSLASTDSLTTCSSSNSNSIETDDVTKETQWESLLYPKFGNGRLPNQADATKWLKFLIYIPVIALATTLVSMEILLRTALRYGIVQQMDRLLQSIWTDSILFTVALMSVIMIIVSAIVPDLHSIMMLWYGKQTRSLPLDPDKRLVHAVVICQYKEPLEVLDATVQSLVDGTLACNTIVLLACEARDPFADDVFEILESKYSQYFRNFIKTTHELSPGEVIGKSSNENHAVRQLYSYIMQEGIDPFDVMVTVCDADSLFDPVFLEHVEAEFWRMPDGRRVIYNAPINTYRNLRECDLFVQVVEMARCQDDVFPGLMAYRPSQSNYSLTLGFCHEIDYWDPTNTAEDFHTALKAMAFTGQGTTVVVQVWSLILNDSVCSTKDRWTQAKRHMWGIEECAWTMELYSHLRFKRWISLIGLTFGRMILSGSCLPSSPLLFLPSVRACFFSLEVSTQRFFIGVFVVQKLVGWIQVVIREVVIRRFILADRKHMLKAGWKNWLVLVTPLYIIIEQASLFFFYTFATWAMLWHACHHNTILYVTAPKSFTTNEKSEKAIDEVRKSV